MLFVTCTVLTKNWLVAAAEFGSPFIIADSERDMQGVEPGSAKPTCVEFELGCVNLQKLEGR